MIKIQPEVAKQTKKITVITIGGLLLMWLVFLILHQTMPEKVPFDYTVILGGLAGSAVAVLSFLQLGLTVQKAVSTSDEDQARLAMKSGYSQRMMIRTLWVIAAIVAPCFHFAAGIMPLLFPNTGIKLFYKWMADDSK